MTKKDTNPITIMIKDPIVIEEGFLSFFINFDIAAVVLLNVKNNSN